MHDARFFDVGQGLHTAIYLSDEVPDSTVNLRLRGPDGAVAASWTHVGSNTYSASYWYWIHSISAATTPGTWHFEAELDGKTLTASYVVAGVFFRDGFE